MRRYFGLGLAILGVLALAGTAQAIKWPTDMSYRIETMGGAKLSIEGETASITTFNHENLAGLALLGKVNRADLGLFYASDETKTTVAPGVEYKTTSTDLELTRPGGQFRGVTYWLDDNLVIRGGIEGLMTTMSTSMTGAPEEKLSFSGIGGGLSVGYLIMPSLAVGAGFAYVGAGGKPDSLTGAFNVVGMMSPFGGETTKFEFSATNLAYGLGAAYVADLGDQNALTFGAQFGADDDRPNLTGLDLSSASSMLAFNDYTMVATIEGNAFTPLGDVAIVDKTTITPAPMKVGGEIIFNMAKMLEAGLLIDYKTKELKQKSESTQAGVTSSTEYKVLADSNLGISPIVRGKFDLGGVNLLPGISYSTLGTGTTDMFAPNPMTADENDVFKYGTTAKTAGVLGIGVGMQALEKQLALALQYDMGNYKNEAKSLDFDGNQVGSTATSESTSSAIRVGGEFWVMPILALRAGYALLNTTDKADSTIPGDVDVKYDTNRITFGAGLSLQGFIADLLVKLDSYKQDPAPDPAPTHSAMGVYLGLRLPI